MEDLQLNQLRRNKILKIVLPELIERYGEGFTTEQVLEYATPKRSPLHRFLEWDDKKAGNSYRLWQCRKLISLMILNEVEGERAVISFKLNEETKRGYWTVETIMTDKDLKKAALHQLYKDAISLYQKYQKFNEVFEIISPNSLQTFKEKHL
jgi:hypothetical protein